VAPLRPHFIVMNANLHHQIAFLINSAPQIYTIVSSGPTAGTYLHRHDIARGSALHERSRSNSSVKGAMWYVSFSSMFFSLWKQQRISSIAA
jgi:hypothetical protein